MARYKTGSNVPKALRTELQCLECKQFLPTSRFKREGGKTTAGNVKYCARCDVCQPEYARRHYRQQAQLSEVKNLINSAKSCCSVCKYSRCKAALDFHHVDASTKLFDLSAARTFGKYQIDVVKQEINKCLVLCSNCHREHHAGVLDISNIPRVLLE